MGLNILDLVADGAAALLEGLDPCSVITNLTMNADGDITSRPNGIATATVAALPETKTGLATKTIITNKNKGIQKVTPRKQNNNSNTCYM